MRRARRKKFCYFTANGITEIDYKDIELLDNFISDSGKIFSKPKHRHQG